MAKTQVADEEGTTQIHPVDPNDAEFVQYLLNASQDERVLLTDVLSDVTQKIRDRRSTGGETEETEGTGTGTGSVRPAPPLADFFAYKNRRPDVDWNTCGQAAIASMVDYYDGDIGLPPAGGHWQHGAAIDRIVQAGYGPDVVFGWGTTPGRVRDGLVSFGVPAEVGHSGLFFDGWPNQWNRLLAYVYYSAIPVPVLIDTGLLGGPAWGAHWPILWKMDFSPTRGLRVYLGNWMTSEPIDKERFLQAWAARQLPLGMNHAAVYTGTPRIRF